MINNVFTDLGGVSLGSNVNYSLATTYTVSAVNKSDRVLFTVKVNGLPEVTLEDTTAERLLSEGYFGMGLCEGYPNAILTIGKDILQAPKMTSPIYNISVEQVITNVHTGTLINEFNMQTSNNGDNLVFKDALARLLDYGNPSTVIGTGASVRVQIGANYTIYKVIVYGDVDGDGAISISDLTKTKKHLLNITALTADFKIAGDIFKKGNIGIGDLLAMKKQILGLQNINQNPIS